VAALPAHRFFPFQAQPAQIFEDSLHVAFARAGDVYVLDAQQEAAAPFPGEAF